MLLIRRVNDKGNGTNSLQHCRPFLCGNNLNIMSFQRNFHYDFPYYVRIFHYDAYGMLDDKTFLTVLLERQVPIQCTHIRDFSFCLLWPGCQGSRQTLQLTSSVTSNRPDFTGQNKFFTSHRFTNSFYEKWREGG